MRERTKDTWGLWRRGVLDPESNVQFGEGGAGTFSDGKLYSQIKDPRHLGRKVLTEFVEAGAPEEILYRRPSAYRHVPAGEHGRDRCAPTIESLGGEYRFGSQGHRSCDRGRRRMRGVAAGASASEIDDGSCRARDRATARATRSRCLHERGVVIEAKPFSIGFRIEHPQGLIDRARFGASAGNPILGAADYKLVHHATQWPLRLQFLHVPGRHGGRRDLASRAAS